MALKPHHLAEIESLRNQKSQTIRPVSPKIEEVLYLPFEVLEHGFVRVVDYMGNDSSVVQAARVSYGAGTKKVSDDSGLINYLMAHQHTTPFEMCEIKFHIKLPIFVARQWIRHRMASINEYSARYSLMEDEFYIPSSSNLAAQSKTNHQGRDESKILSPEEQKQVLQILREDSSNCYQNYLAMINQNSAGETLDSSKEGVARELARMNLTLNCFTQWYWKIDLHNLFHFLRLRSDSHAQYEIRVYAEIILNLVKKWVPLSFEAFEKHSLTGKRFSGPALEVLKKLLYSKKVEQPESGLSKREWQELMELIKP